MLQTVRFIGFSAELYEDQIKTGADVPSIGEQVVLPDDPTKIYTVENVERNYHQKAVLVYLA